MKIVKQFLAVTLIALLLEIGVFHFSELRLLLDDSLVKNQAYSLSDFIPVNWVGQDGSVLVSQPDPQLILADVGCYVKTLELSYEKEGSLSNIVLFYTDSTTPAFSGDALIQVAAPEKSETQIQLERDVTSLRIDLGDEPGLRLRDLRLVVNPAVMDLSMPRIVTVFLLFFVGKFLFSLQKSPDYQLEEVTPDPAEEDTP